MSAGTVYVIQAGAYFKIGRTANLAQRLVALQTGSPLRLVVIHTHESDDSEALEQDLHHAFAHVRVSGEWYRLTGADVERLKLMCRMPAQRPRDQRVKTPRRPPPPGGEFARQIEIDVWACTCEVCGHEWTTQGDALPRRCTNHACRSIRWNRSTAAAGLNPACHHGPVG